MSRPDWMEAKLGRLGALIEDEETTKARALLEEVRLDLGDDPSLLALTTF